MQAIARANRVTSYTIKGVTKTNGEIVDYYNVFRNMQKALSVYAAGSDEEAKRPVRDKSNLFTLLDDAVAQGMEFCRSLGMDLNSIPRDGEVFKNIGLFKQYADKLLEKDDNWKEFRVYENTITSLYEACKPEILAEERRQMVPVFQYLRGVLDACLGEVDVDKVRLLIGELLDASIVTANADSFLKEWKHEFQIVRKGKVLDLSKINIDKLKQNFKERECKNIEIADLRGFIEKKLDEMLKENSTRIGFVERLQAIIDRYNSGGSVTEDYFNDLLKFTEELKAEEERHIKEKLTKDELEIFDILKRDKMTKAEEIKVKNAAKHLLHRLTKERPKVIVQDWYKDSQSKAKLKTAIEEVLDSDLPDSYSKEIFVEKSNQLYDLIYDYSSRGLRWTA
jgi:type I restriction enzyme R subunit